MTCKSSKRENADISEATRVKPLRGAGRPTGIVVTGIFRQGDAYWCVEMHGGPVIGTFGTLAMTQRARDDIERDLLVNSSGLTADEDPYDPQCPGITKKYPAAGFALRDERCALRPEAAR